MLTGIKFIAQGDTLIEYEKNGGKSAICFSAIESLWSYAAEEDFEGGTAKIIDEKILFSMLTASGQGGIVAVWDTDAEEIEHISEGSYCVAVDIHNDKVYRLLCVSNFTTKTNFQLWETPYGVMDSDEEGKQIDVAFPEIADEFDGDSSNIALKVTDEVISLELNGNTYSIER